MNLIVFGIVVYGVYYFFFKNKGDKDISPEAPETHIQVSKSEVLSSLPKHDLPEYKDERKAECPYCKGVLKKVPGRKTKCPICGKFMYVRTGPDNVRRVLTEENAEEVDKQWRIINGTQGEHEAGQKRFKDRKNKLKKKLGGMEPSDNDVQWGLYNEELLEHMGKGDWGLYRNVKLRMGDLLKKESKPLESLNFYLAVCYLDINGPNNTSGYSDVVQIKAFDPSDGNDFIAPGVVKYIQTIAKKEGVDIVRMGEIFLEYNKRVMGSRKLPVSVEIAWKRLEKEIEKQPT